MVVDGIEGKHEMELLGAFECGGVLVLESHIGQAVMVGHEARYTKCGRLAAGVYVGG